MYQFRACASPKASARFAGASARRARRAIAEVLVQAKKTKSPIPEILDWAFRYMKNRPAPPTGGVQGVCV